MAASTPEPRIGEIFDAVAEAYDRVRPGYPDELVDAACTIGALDAGCRVLEIGCGTGKLTEALAERRLVVDAVDPGENMIAFAKRRVGETSPVTFHLGRFEEVSLPDGAFDAVFSATAFHWIDPTVGWAKAAESLRPGGMIALLMHISFWEEATATNDAALQEVFRKYWHDQGPWYPLRDLETIEKGVEERRDDISEVWTWLGHHDLTNPEAAILFTNLQLTTAAMSQEQTADEVWSFFETTSSYYRLGPEDREALEHETRELFDRHGGALRTSELAVLITAQRT